MNSSSDRLAPTGPLAGLRVLDADFGRASLQDVFLEMTRR